MLRSHGSLYCIKLRSHSTDDKQQVPHDDRSRALAGWPADRLERLLTCDDAGSVDGDEVLTRLCVAPAHNVSEIAGLGAADDSHPVWKADTLVQDTVHLLVAVPERELKVKLAPGTRDLHVRAIEETTDAREVDGNHAGSRVVRVQGNLALNSVIVHVEAVHIKVEAVDDLVAVVGVHEVDGRLEDARELRVVAAKLLLQRDEARRVGEAEDHETEGVLAAALGTIVASNKLRKVKEDKEAVKVALAEAQHVPAEVVRE